MEWDEGHSGFLTNTLNVTTLAFETLHENKNKQQQNVNCSKVLNWRPLRFSLDTVLFGLTWHLPVGKSIIFFENFLEGISPFCGSTDIPVLDWWYLPWV